MTYLRIWWCSFRHADTWEITRVSRAGQLGEVRCGKCDGHYLTHRWDGGLLPWPLAAERLFAPGTAAEVTQ